MISTSCIALAEAPDGERRLDGEDRRPLALLGLEVIDELISSLAVEADVKRLERLERRIHQEPEGTAGLEDGTMPGVLRKQRPLALAAWRQADAGTSRVRKRSDFHVCTC